MLLLQSLFRNKQCRSWMLIGVRWVRVNFDSHTHFELQVGSQAEFIYSVSWEILKYADMHAKGVSLIHLYSEGCGKCVVPCTFAHPTPKRRTFPRPTLHKNCAANKLIKISSCSSGFLWRLEQKWLVTTKLTRSDTHPQLIIGPPFGVR